MQYEENGKIIQGVGGLFEVALDAGTTPLSGCRVSARAKGNFRHEGLVPLPGDRVRLAFDESAFSREEEGNRDGGGAVIREILDRKNALIRPPMANLDHDCGGGACPRARNGRQADRHCRVQRH